MTKWDTVAKYGAQVEQKSAKRPGNRYSVRSAASSAVSNSSEVLSQTEDTRSDEGALGSDLTRNQ